MKSLVYETPVNSAKELVARISAAAGEIRNTPEMLSNVRRSMKRRCEACITCDGLNRLEYIKLYCRNSNLGHHTGQANAVRGINADQIRLARCTQSCFPVAQSDGKERKEKAHISNIFNCLHLSCQVIYSQFGLAIHQNDHQARRRFVEWAQNEIAVVPDFHKRILFSDEAHFWLNGYVNKQNCRIWSEANPQVYVETPLHPEKLTVWCALWAGGILLQK
ncbi:hypothetical protein TNCV_1931291 [Trichonephila clavipes]|nr:hypothetical protein TNCV_1931291 [Trichonephila clavipes]